MKQNAQCLSLCFTLFQTAAEGPKKTSEEELKTKLEAPEKIITIIIIVVIIIIIISIITVTLSRSVEISGFQSHNSAYLQGLLPQNS